MSFTETMTHLSTMLSSLLEDISKVYRGNKSAAQRVRVNTIKLEKLGKLYRKESLTLEKKGKLKKKRPKKRKKKA